MTQKLKITQQAYSSKEKIPENATLKQLMHIANLLGVELVSLLPDDKKEMQKKLPASLSAAGQMFGKHNEKRLLRHALGFANPAKKRNC